MIFFALAKFWKEINPKFCNREKITVYKICTKIYSLKFGINPDKRGQISARFDQSALRADFASAKSGLKI